MTTGDEGRTPPDAEHYLDLSDVEDDQPGPHFDVVLRGYDRRQVDDHVAGLRRMVGQLKAQLAVRQRRVAATGVADPTIPEARPAADASSSAEGDGRSPDMVGAFNDRLQGILQAAEQEAQVVRSRAAESLLAEHAESRAALADLRAQRDAVFDDLVRLRGWLDELVATAGRPASPPPTLAAHGGPPAGPRPGPWARPPGPGPAGRTGYHPQPPGPPPARPRPWPGHGPDDGPAVDAHRAGAGQPETEQPDGEQAGPSAGEPHDGDPGVGDLDAPTTVTDLSGLDGEPAVDPDSTDATIVPVDRSAG